MVIILMILKCDQIKLSLCNKTSWLSAYKTKSSSFDQLADQPKTFRMLNFWAHFIFSLYSPVDFLRVYKDQGATTQVTFHSGGCGVLFIVTFWTFPSSSQKLPVVWSIPSSLLTLAPSAGSICPKLEHRNLKMRALEWQDPSQGTSKPKNRFSLWLLWIFTVLFDKVLSKMTDKNRLLKNSWSWHNLTLPSKTNHDKWLRSVFYSFAFDCHHFCHTRLSLVL